MTTQERMQNAFLHDFRNPPGLRYDRQNLAAPAVDEEDLSTLGWLIHERLKEMGVTDNRGRVILERLIAAEDDANDWISENGHPKASRPDPEEWELEEREARHATL